MKLSGSNALRRSCRKTLKTLKQVHAIAVTQGLSRHQTSVCKLLNAYAEVGNPRNAHKLFDVIPEPDIVSWTSLISLYLRTQRPAEAFSTFSRLVLSGLCPDSFSVVGALSACGRARNVIGGKIVHGVVVRLQLGSGQSIVGNALIDMYGRNGDTEAAVVVFRTMSVKDIASWTSLLNGFVVCNDIGTARKVFDEMPQRNAISWTAMITGYVRGNTPIRALEIFRQMRAEGKDKPTTVTVVAVLSGCADIGALDFGQAVHGYVSKSYLRLDVAVNNTLLDMYSKSGGLEASLTIFRQMNERDEFSWTAMISAYALHGKGSLALEVFYDMTRSGLAPNEVTFLSVLSGCSHAGLVTEGRKLFKEMTQSYGCSPKIEHYGCMADLLSRTGLLGEAKEFIEQMPISPDVVIWRSLLSACLVHKNLELAEMAGEKVMELDPDDDGVYVLLWNVYFSANKKEAAQKMRKMMREQKVKKKPGRSWVEVNGVVHEFHVEDARHYVREDIYSALETMNELLKLDFEILFY